MATVETYVTVDVELDEFSDEDLIEELDRRGCALTDSGTKLVEKIYQNRRLGKDFKTELDQLIYLVTGRVV